MGDLDFRLALRFAVDGLVDQDAPHEIDRLDLRLIILTRVLQPDEPHELEPICPASSTRTSAP